MQQGLFIASSILVSSGIITLLLTVFNAALGAGQRACRILGYTSALLIAIGLLALVCVYYLDSERALSTILYYYTSETRTTLSVLISTAVIGATIALCVLTALHEEDRILRIGGLILMILVVLQLIFYIVYGSRVGFESIGMWDYWIASIIVGALFPVLCIAHATFMENRAWLSYVSLACTLIGAVGIRMTIWYVAPPLF